MFDPQHRYVIPDYQNRPTFSSFLPGIAGPWGIPTWVYYNNRGQAVCSFGAQDKDHAVLEFCPAHTAYQNNARTGFRTFLRRDGHYEEAFTGQCHMHIGMTDLEISWHAGGLEASAVYFVLPFQRAAGLVRRLRLRNTSPRPMELEVLDGLPAIVPYGVGNERLKNLTQLSKAWMQAEDMETGRPYFRVRASMEDTARVTPVEGGSFGLAMDETGGLLHPIVDPSLVFEEDSSLAAARGFAAQGADLAKRPQCAQNQFPCCFFPLRRTLQPGEELRLDSLYGQTESREILRELAEKISGPDWFAKRHEEALELTERLTDPVAVKTADPLFDAYCRQTYLDNLLRGGTPVFFRDGAAKTPFYLYSRKHGDPEREYNAFSLGSEYYAQGNGNFRDVAQNRRSDVLFCPEVEDAAVRDFYELIQSDGYNPLVLTVCTFRMEEAAARELARELPATCRVEAVELLTGDYTPGKLAMHTELWGLSRQEGERFAARCICRSQSEPNADFAEGYWCDHWTYHLDLIERYLAVYPEQEKALLFDGEGLRWYETRRFILPRSKRYELTEDGLRQYRFLDPERKCDTPRKWMQTSSGQEARSALVEKLAVLCALKTATLDAGGMGIEMEGGRPGWYDALNGLPGLLGSSMAETCELERLLDFTAGALERHGGKVSFYTEMLDLIHAVDAAALCGEDPFICWDAANYAKEVYRERTADGVEGTRRSISGQELSGILRRFEKRVLQGISRARQYSDICPTYFTFTAQQMHREEGGWMPGKLTPHPLPLFLEGPVRWMKLDWPREEKEKMARLVGASDLYDSKLSMYKVNASLNDVSPQVGRARAFTPGWLENESIWLHMEYKYLLELLKSGLYEDFSKAFRDAAVPFLTPETYGRSPLENVSFIASSANADPTLRGRGFVARMTGATAEFLDMWQRMFFGDRPFRVKEGRLTLALAPMIPAYLMPPDGTVEAVFLGGVDVTYQAPGKRELIPGHYTVRSYLLIDREGLCREYSGGELPEEAALRVRGGEIRAMTVKIC